MKIDLSIVIPAYDEQDRLGDSVGKFSVISSGKNSPPN